MSLTLKKKDSPVFLTDLPQLERHLATPSANLDIVLGGQLLMCSLEPLPTQEGFVSQPSRAIEGGRFQRAKTNRRLEMLLDKRALEALVRARQKPRFAMDALLRYGLKLKGSGEHYVLGAFEGSSFLQVLVLTFKKQELKAYTEYQLSSPQTYTADLQLLMTRLEQASPSSEMHWCGPVPSPRPQDLPGPSPALWALAPTQALTLTGRPSALKRHGAALAVFALACAGYVGALYAPYYEYQGARKALAQESETLKGETAFDADRLSLLRSRQAFFETQKAANQRLSQFIEVLAAFAQEPDVQVKDAVLFSALNPARGAPPGQIAAFEIVVEVPRASGVSVLDQGRPLLQSLSAKIGGDLRIATGGGGYREAETASGARTRQYIIQGDFKRAI